MKKYLLPLLLAAAFLFTGFEKAFATAIAITANTAATPNTNTAFPSQANVVLYSFTVSNTSGATTATGTTFAFNNIAAAATFANASTATLSLYSYTGSSTFPGFTVNGTTAATLCGTLPAPGTTNFTITDTKAIAKNTTYFFLVENFLQPTTAGMYQFNLTGIGGGQTTTSTFTAGNQYSWSAYTPTSITLTSYNTPGTNGLSYNPLNTNQSNVAVYGFSLMGGAGTSNASLLQLVTHTSTGTIFNQLYQYAYLWSSPTSTFNYSTATQISRYTSSNGDTYATFNLATGTAITVAPNTTTYYFVTYDEPDNLQTNADQNYYSSIGNPVTSGSPTTGYLYTFSTTTLPTVTAATNQANTSPANNGTIIQGTSGYALASMKLTSSSGTSNVSNITFTYSTPTAFSNYFGTPVLYSSSSSTFSGATPVTGAVATVSTTAPYTISFALPNTATCSSAGTYYYLVLNYTGSATTGSVTFVPSSYTTFNQYNSSSGLYYNNDLPATVGYSVNTYTCQPPAAVQFSSANSATGMAATTQNGSANNLSIFGFQVTTTANTSLSSLTFTGTQTWATYFSGYTLLKNSSPTLTGATTATTGTITNPTATTLMVPLTESVNNTTEYYFLVANYTAGATSVMFTPSLTTAVTSAGTYTASNGVPITGPAYTLNPPIATVTLTSFNMPGANGLAYNPLYVGETVVPVYGFSLVGSGPAGATASISSITLHEPVNYIYNTIGTTLTLWTSTSSIFSTTTATKVPGATYTSPGNDNYALFTPTTAISIATGATLYYFVTEDYTYVGASSSELDFSTNTGNTTIVTSSPTGYLYTDLVAPTITSNNNVTGLNPAAGSVIYPSPTSLAVASMQIISSTNSAPTASPVVLTSMVFTLSTSVATAQPFFGTTATLWSSSSPNFTTSTATQITTAVASYSAAATTPGTVTFNIPNSVAASVNAGINASGTYFFMVLTYTGTAPANPQVFTFAPTSFTTSCGSSNSPSYPGNQYTCGSPVYVAASSYNGFAPVTIVATQPDPGVAFFGFSISNSTAATYTTFNFTTKTGSTALPLSTYFSNLTLYSSTTNNFANATQVTIPAVDLTNAAGSFTVSIPAASQQTIGAGGTLYYFIVLDVINIPAASVTFTPVLSSIATASNMYPPAATPADGMPLTEQTYTLKTPSPYTYYWTGAQQGTNANWTNAANWETTFTTGGTGTNAGAYPGATATDAAVFNSACFTTGTTASPLVSNNISVPNGMTIAGVSTAGGTYYPTTVNLTVTSTDSLTMGSVTIGISGGNGARVNELDVYGTASGGVIASLRVTGATNMYNTANFFPNTNSRVNFPSNSSINMVGNSAAARNAYYGTFETQGNGLVTTNNCAVSLGTATVNGGIFGVGNGTGTMSLNGGSVVTMNGYFPIVVNDFNIYMNASKIDMQGTDPECYFSAGTFNASNGSTLLLTSQYADIESNATVNFLGSAITYVGYGGVIDLNSGAFNFGGTTAANASTMNFGTNAGTTVDGELNSFGGNFNLNAYSIINMTGANDANVSNIYNDGGNFLCASTSVINPTGTYSSIYNTGAANTFTLLSDANGSATIGILGANASISGQFNVQRYISTASHGYRMLASAVNVTNKANPALNSASTTAPNLVDLSALGRDVLNNAGSSYYYGAFVGGYLGTSGGFTNTTPGPCLYLNQESIIPDPATEDQSYTGGKNVAVINIKNSNSSGSYTISTANSNTIAMGAVAADNGTTVQVPVGNGYELYYIHSDSVMAVAANLNAAATTATGYINQGTIPVFLFNTQSSAFSGKLTKNTSAALSALSGYNLLGNPYPASIDLNKVYSDNTSTVFTSSPATFNELNPVNEQFVTYQSNGSTSGLNASEYVASGEAFYAVVSTAGTFAFKEDQKVTSATGPSVVMESYPVAGTPAATVDNVAVNNKTTDAVVAGNLKTTADAVSLNYSANNSGLKHNNAKNASDTKTATFIPPMISFKDSTVKHVNVPAVRVQTITASTVSAPPAAAAAIPGLHLKLVMDSINYDECGLYFKKEWSDNFDNKDAKDMDGNAGKVFLSSYSADDVRTGINSLGDYKGGKRVKLYAGFSASGLYQLQMEDIFNFNTNKYSVFLIDNLLKDSLDLTLYKSYNFNYTPGTANDSTRFVLAIEHKPVPHYALLAFAGAKVTEGVKLNWTTQNEANYTTFVLQKLDAGNTYAFLDSLQSDSAGAYSYVDQHPVLGSNTYRLQQTDGLGNITYSSLVTIGYNSTTPNGGLTIYPNPSKAMITVTLATGSTATAVATADIYNSSGVLVEHKVVNSNSFTHDISPYNLGVYIIQLKNSNGIIVGNSKFVKVN